MEMPKFRFLSEWVVERGAVFWGVWFFGGVVANVGSERGGAPYILSVCDDVGMKMRWWFSMLT